MDEYIFLHGLALRNYRGIGPKLQLMAPFRTFNIFIGANNAGKSSVLSFISKYLPLDKKGNMEPAALEHHDGATTNPIATQLGIPLDVFLEPARKKLGSARSEVGHALETLGQGLSVNGLIWLEYNIPHRHPVRLIVPSGNLRSVLPQHLWNWLWSALWGVSGGDIDHWVSQTIERLLKMQQFALPTTHLIPAIREVGPKSEGFSDYSGRGLIDRIAELQSPDHDKRQERELFNRINAFIQNVTDHPEAQIEVPHNREHILVHMDGKVLPLSSLGTGIQEVVMIAAFCTISEGQIVCIEEPELHLHPLLQRKLLEYLREKTTNQYFIATHSAAFIDTPEAAIFHVAQHDSFTRIEEAVLRSERYEICIDLGHKASDLLQSNAVIWVEGPSDRIYIRHWIDAVAPNLIEGIHYSIMFYGGRLLSHLSAEDDEVTEFIGLKSLNRNPAIVIDSDKSRPSDKINQTKARLVAEFTKNGDLAWVTKGREIENYIPHSILQDAVRQIYGDAYGAPLKGERYDHSLHFRRSSPRRLKGKSTKTETEVDKVKVAREVCGQVAVLDVLDLRKQINQLVEMIKKAND